MEDERNISFDDMDTDLGDISFDDEELDDIFSDAESEDTDENGSDEEDADDLDEDSSTETSSDADDDFVDDFSFDDLDIDDDTDETSDITSAFDDEESEESDNEDADESDDADDTSDDFDDAQDSDEEDSSDDWGDISDDEDSDSDDEDSNSDDEDSDSDNESDASDDFDSASEDDDDLDNFINNNGESDDDIFGDDEFNAEDAGDESSETETDSGDTEDDSEDIDDTDFDGGAVISPDDIEDDEDDDTDYSGSRDFISDSGGLVVQDTNDTNELGFELRYISIENIAITKNRVRKLESVESLVQSIKSTGLLTPIVVAPTQTNSVYVLIDGFRRIQACLKAGKKRIPCIVNNKVSTPEIPILESMYNNNKGYTIKEKIDYIEFLEKEKGLFNHDIIEMLAQLNSGDYVKLKDILNDNDDDIVTKLLDGSYDIATAFKKLEQRRKKESAQEKEDKQAAKVYGDEHESGIDQVQGSGDETTEALTEEQIEALQINLSGMDDEVENQDINDMVQEDNEIDGYAPHKQKVGEREYMDPAIRKATMARDNFTCKCCSRGGEQYVDILDLHHVIPVYCGGVDSVENSVMLCVACHRLVHLYATGDLKLQEALLKSEYDELDDKQKERYPNEEIFKDEQKRFKKIIYLGGKIRKAAAAKGMNREKLKSEHPNTGIGRRKPGKDAPQEHA